MMLLPITLIVVVIDIGPPAVWLDMQGMWLFLLLIAQMNNGLIILTAWIKGYALRPLGFLPAAGDHHISDTDALWQFAHP